jgi:hypothetical protein
MSVPPIGDSSVDSSDCISDASVCVADFGAATGDAVSLSMTIGWIAEKQSRRECNTIKHDYALSK